MLDMFFRPGNPTNSWTRDPELSLTIDLLAPSLNSIEIGSQLDQFFFLGRSTSKGKYFLEFADLGISIDNETDRSASGIVVNFDNQWDDLLPFKGKLHLNNHPTTVATLMNDLGQPWWRDVNEEEILSFFEFQNYEIQIEQTLREEIKTIIITCDPLMADPAQRERYGVTKPWPTA